MESAKGQLREAEAVLKDRLGTDSSAQGRLQLGAIYAFRTLAAAVSDKPEHALAVGQEALNLLPSENAEFRAYATNSLGVAYYYLGNLPGAVQTLTEGGALARKAGNLFPMIAAASYQAEALVCQGELRQAAHILQQALDRAQIPGQATASWMPAASYVCVGFGNLLYEWNRLEEAEHYLREAIELGQELAFGSAPWSAYQTLARIKLMHGDQKSAREMIMMSQHYGRIHSLPIPRRLIEATQARAWLALGQLEEAQRWARSYVADDSPSPGLVQEFENITLARLYLLQGKPDRALAVLEQIHVQAEANGHTGRVIEITVLIALAQHALNETRLALQTLRAALKLAEPEGYVRTFVDEGQPMGALLYQTLAQGVMPDYVGRLLVAAFLAEDTTSNPSLSSSKTPQIGSSHEQLIEPLSERELEVLQLMASGASNQDIAAAMIIAVTTTKKHVSNIIRKLGVNNRTQAVTKGRTLGLCE
jgi:LuxR family maltose regulon positive regulatory protein